MDAGAGLVVEAVLKNQYASRSVDAPAGGELRLSDEARDYTCTETSATISGPSPAAIAWRLTR